MLVLCLSLAAAFAVLFPDYAPGRWLRQIFRPGRLDHWAVAQIVAVIAAGLFIVAFSMAFPLEAGLLAAAGDMAVYAELIAAIVLISSQLQLRRLWQSVRIVCRRIGLPIMRAGRAARRAIRRRRGPGLLAPKRDDDEPDPGLDAGICMNDAEAELESFIVRFTPEVAAIGREAVAKLRARLPNAEVLVYDNYNALAVGFAPSQRASEAILSIAFYPRWVSLFLLQATALDDPHKLLKGNGNVVRHIVLKSAADLDDPQISILINQALVTAKAPLDPTATGRLTIKSIAEKQRARRP